MLAKLNALTSDALLNARQIKIGTDYDRKNRQCLVKVR